MAHTRPYFSFNNEKIEYFIVYSVMSRDIDSVSNKLLRLFHETADGITDEVCINYRYMQVSILRLVDLNRVGS